MDAVALKLEAEHSMLRHPVSGPKQTSMTASRHLQLPLTCAAYLQTREVSVHVLCADERPTRLDNTTDTRRDTDPCSVQGACLSFDDKFFSLVDKSAFQRPVFLTTSSSLVLLLVPKATNGVLI